MGQQGDKILQNCTRRQNLTWDSRAEANKVTKLYKILHGTKGRQNLIETIFNLELKDCSQQADKTLQNLRWDNKVTKSYKI